MKPTKLALRFLFGVCAFLVAYGIGVTHSTAWMAPPQLSYTVFLMAFLYGSIAAVFALALRTERAAWRFTSFDDLLRLIRATVLANLTFLLVLFTVQRALSLPRSVVVLTALLDFSFIAAARIARRAMSEGRNPLCVLIDAKGAPDGGQSLLLVGDLTAAESYLRDIGRTTDGDYRVIGIVGDSASDVGLEVRGAPVIGTAAELDVVVRHLTRAGEVPAAVLFLDNTAETIHAEQAGQLRAAGVKLLRRHLDAVALALGDRLGVRVAAVC